MTAKEPDQSSLQTTDIIGFSVSTRDFDSNFRLIDEAARSGEGLWVMTLNLEMLARAATDPNYRALVEKADFVIADGAPIVILSHVKARGIRIKGRSCGVDLVEHALKHFTGRIGIVGGVEPMRAVHRLARDPASVAYHFNGKIDPDHLDDILIGIKESGCQLVFVALGVPKQDKVCHAVKECCPGVVCIGVGGSFEILGGTVLRAPRIVRAVGCEWLFRLLQEPRRLAGRYFVLYPRVVPSLLAWAIGARRSEARPFSV